MPTDHGAAMAAAMVSKMQAIPELAILASGRIFSDVTGRDPMPPLVMVTTISEERQVIGDTDSVEAVMQARIVDQARTRERLNTMVGLVWDHLEFDQDPDQETIIVQDFFRETKPTSTYNDQSGEWIVDIRYRAFITAKET